MQRIHAETLCMLEYIPSIVRRGNSQYLFFKKILEIFENVFYVVYNFTIE